MNIKTFFSKYKYIIIAVVAVVIIVVIFILVTPSSKETSKEEADIEIGVNTVNFEDSIATGNLHAIASIEADFPQDTTYLVSNNIREWISEELGGEYDGNMLDGQQMIEFYAKNALHEFQEFVHPLEDHFVEGYWGVSVRKVYETPKFISYEMSMEDYSGGAHGSAIETGMTFRKADGRRIDWSIIPKSKQQALSQMLAQYVMTQYFESNNTDEFYESLMLEDVSSDFPLPVSTPIFVEDGVKITYQQYEIACYAAGMPTCTIPYNVIDTLLTQTGRNLLNK